MNARLTILGILVLAMAVALSIAGNYLITYNLIRERQSVWCPLLSSFHVPAHPTPEQARGFAQITAVRRGLGCP